MDSQLPSGVLDWKVHSPISPLLVHPAVATMKAAGSAQAACAFSSNGLTLLPPGFVFDRVAYIGGSFTQAVPAPGSHYTLPKLAAVPSF